MKFLSAYKNEVKNEVTISVTGYIGEDFRGGDFIRYLRMWHDNTEQVNLDFFSFGGSAFDAIAIYEFLTTNGYNVTANIYGFCGSAATIIACAAKVVNMGQHAFFFIHNAYDGYSGEQDENTAKVSEQLVEIYKKKTGLDRRVIRKLMNEGDKGAILGAKEAQEYGFINNIIKEKQSVAAAWGQRFAGQEAPAAPSINSNTETMNFNLIEWVKAQFNTEVKTEEEAHKFLQEKAPEIINKAAQPPAGEGEAAKADDSRVVTLETTVAALQKEMAKASDVAAVQTNLEAVLGKVTELAEAVKASQETVQAQAQQSQAQESEFQAKINALGETVQTLRAFPSAKETGKADSPPAVVAEAQKATGNPNVVVSTAAKAVNDRILGRTASN